jgi:prepilin-type N-terminal cleavage/methylation domain-containing protein
MRRQGFTVVELLIVITVIAILAAITTIAYNGIQGRAYDTAVQSDIRTMGNKASIVLADTGSPPNSNQTGLQDIVKVSKDAYLLRSTISLIYCRATDRFAFIAISKNNNVYVYTSQGGGLKQGGSWSGSGGSGSCTNANTTNDAAFSGGTNIILLQNSAWVTWL